MVVDARFLVRAVVDIHDLHPFIFKGQFVVRRLDLVGSCARVAPRARQTNPTTQNGLDSMLSSSRKLKALRENWRNATLGP
jgi:hypothetical protein